jgi:NAD(P) transhydrogenase subunit alpha
VISTASVPGRPAPKIISRAMVEGMQPGAVIVDLSAESGGNCELTEPGKTLLHQGVTIDGPLNLASQAALHASEMFAKNLINLLDLLLQEGALRIDREDEVIAGCLLTHAGELVHAATAKALSA